MIHQLLNPDSNAGNFLRLTKTDSYCCGDKATKQYVKVRLLIHQLKI
jgi:hypothetical protein